MLAAFITGLFVGCCLTLVWYRWWLLRHARRGEF